MTNTDTFTPVHEIANLKNLASGNYSILKSDDSCCIYKLLELDSKSGEYLKLQVHDDYSRYHFVGSRPKIYTISIDQHPSNFNSIFLTTQGEVMIPHDSPNRWGREIMIGISKISINWMSGKIVEENGVFFERIIGCNFPIKQNQDFLNFTLQHLDLIDDDFEIASRFLKRHGQFRTYSKGDGVIKTMTKIEAFANNELNYFYREIFNILLNSTKSTSGGIKFSVYFNRIFAGIETQEAFSALLKSLSKIMVSVKQYQFIEKVIDSLPESRDMKKAALKRKSTGAINKMMDDLDFVQIDQEKFPLTHEAVHSGEIPIGTFFRKSGENYFIYNDNWELWEPMLKDHKEIAINIASSCSGRTTYEKDLMSYFYFTLFELPEYLKAQTGRTWKGIPKMINSANELDPPTEGSNGVAKSRSALTPIVDNENCTVTVPYVSMAINGGYGTTYCYGLNYSVLKKGFSHKGNVVMKDVEKALNGRDDYGLMFYTLTGTAQGRGYPTFLIIFERLERDTTKVHFHRVHPTRSKDGEYNSVHNWTITCYKWMIGNVNFERIKAQQGDLAFVQIEKMPEGEITMVNAYDNHKFEREVPFAPYTKKERSNILGYVSLEKETQLIHNEHMNRLIPAGIYEIRQCRSWEANPKGVWSLRID